MPLTSRKQLSIVHVARSPVGGVFRHVSDLVRMQSRAGHRVGLVCDSSTGGGLQDERIAALGPSLELGIARLPMPRTVGPGDIPVIRAVTREIAAMQPDIVHCHGAKGGLYGRIAAALIRRRGRVVAAFYAPHGGSLHFDPRSLSGRVYFAVERALERATDGLIHVSAFEAAAYRAKIGTPRCPQHVVHNGLAPEDFERVEPGPDAAGFLLIGELRDLKGVDVFIDALAALEAEGRAPGGVIVGPATPESEALYHAMAAAKVKARPVIFHPPMPARRAFALARAVALPSRAESLPYVVLEAIAAGMPVITTNVGGIPEIFEGETERLLPPGDVPALAAAMRAALDDPARLAADAALLRERVKQKFSLAAMAARTEDIYRAALEERYRSVRAGVAPEARPAR